MGEGSKIQWTDDTHNFWRGCTKVSPGCANCYAEALDNRFGGGHWGKGKPRVRSKSFDEPLKWNKKPSVCNYCDECNPIGEWTGRCIKCNGKSMGFHRRRVFSLSLGDWLDPEVPIEWLADMLDVVRRCENLDWLLCTKRPELFAERLEAAQDYDFDHGKRITCGYLCDWRSGNYIPPNIMVLASVENQEQADKRIPELLRIPAARRGLSCEPLLGQVDLQNIWLPPSASTLTHKLDWVIIGGESGQGARPCNVGWIRSLKDQCAAEDVPVFVKQLGAFSIQDRGSQRSRNLWSDKKGGDIQEFPTDLQVREFYK